MRRTAAPRKRLPAVQGRKRAHAPSHHPLANLRRCGRRGDSPAATIRRAAASISSCAAGRIDELFVGRPRVACISSPAGGYFGIRGGQAPARPACWRWDCMLATLTHRLQGGACERSGHRRPRHGEAGPHRRSADDHILDLATLSAYPARLCRDPAVSPIRCSIHGWFIRADQTQIAALASPARRSPACSRNSATTISPSASRAPSISAISPAFRPSPRKSSEGGQVG